MTEKVVGQLSDGDLVLKKKVESAREAAEIICTFTDQHLGEQYKLGPMHRIRANGEIIVLEEETGKEEGAT